MASDHGTRAAPPAANRGYAMWTFVQSMTQPAMRVRGCQGMDNVALPPFFTVIALNEIAPQMPAGQLVRPIR